MRGFLGFYGLLLAMALGAPLAGMAAGKEQLIVFQSEGKSAVEREFMEKTLPKLKELAKAQSIEVVERMVAKGAPAEVQATPAIFFQNHLGRSQFIGRYTLSDKVLTFVNTARRMPQKEATNQKHDVLVWKKGRATIYSPIKLTPLSGELPSGFDEAGFHEKALQALASGTKEATFMPTLDALRGHRAMYLALYPYLAADGKFFVSAEMYSQFNCVDPLYRRFDEPFKGEWKAWSAVFAEAGASLQAEVFRQLASPARGDGMLPLPEKTPLKDWKALGLPLPKFEGGNAAPVADIALARRWQYGGPVTPGSPVINFSFLAPLDYYAGEVKQLFGGLEFGEGPAIGGSVGKFGIELPSLTMGDPALDAHVREMLRMVEHPQSHFTFAHAVALENPQVRVGTVTQLTVGGMLEFMGVAAPIDVIAQLEPGLDAQGDPQISVLASFALRLKERYGLDGPDGPMPAKDSMQFSINFLLKPAA